MSVTFHAEFAGTDHFTVTCVNCNVTTGPFTTHEDTETFILAVRNGTATFPGCQREEDECDWAMFSTPHEAGGDLPEVNIANGNAMDILDTLGIDYRYEPTPEELEHDFFGLAGVELLGSMDAQEFLGRVLMGLAVAPESAEIPAHAAVGAPNIIRAHREPGYIQHTLERLHEVAQAAAANNRQVAWA